MSPTISDALIRSKAPRRNGSCRASPQTRGPCPAPPRRSIASEKSIPSTADAPVASSIGT